MTIAFPIHFFKLILLIEMEVNGVPNIRTCITQVKDGMLEVNNHF